MNTFSISYPDLSRMVFVISESIADSMPIPLRETESLFAGIGFLEGLAIVSVLMTCMGVWYARRRTRISARREAIEIAKQQRTEPAIQLYLANCHVQKHNDSQRHVHVFSLLVTNQSLAANSIRELLLSLEFRSNGQPPRNLVCAHDAEVAQELGMDSAKVFSVPRPIAGGESIAGVAIFPVASAFLNQHEVESYTLTVRDAHENESCWQAFLLKENES